MACVDKLETGAEAPPTAREGGFTLIEVMVATLLVGIVMAMAMNGFSAAKRASDLSRSQALATEESARAVKEISDIVRRAAIVFYSGVPLKGTSAANATLTTVITVPGTPGNVPLVTSNQVIPAIFKDTPYVAVPQVKYSMSDPTQPIGVGAPMDRTQFRFQCYNDGYFRDTNAVGGTKQRLRSSNPNLPTQDQFFSAPLLYAAEPIFSPEDTTSGVGGLDGGVGGGHDPMGSMPIGWNFYVVYLAPMDLNATPSSALCPATGGSIAAKRDLGGDPNDPGKPQWQRSTVPFELRLLTIRNVSAGTNPTSPWFGRRPYNEPGPAPQRQAVPPVPWDYDTGGCNYDPILLSDAGSAQSMLVTTPGYNPFNVGSGVHGVNRVRTAGADFPHGNFRALGNDPPSNDCFSDNTCFLPTAVTGNATTLQANSSDRVIANWIDPDNPNGTFVRFENPLSGADANEGANPFNTVGNPLFGTQRYVNAYEGGFQYQTPMSSGAGLVPVRALVSVTTRYRTGRDIAFTFSTKSEEVSLDASVNYQNNTIRRTYRN